MLSNKENSSSGIRFTAMQSTKFKASVLVFSVTVPLSPQYLINNVLLSGLLRRGTHALPSMAELNRSLDELYGSYIEIRSATLGNNLSLVLSAEVLDNKYIPDGTDAIGGVIDIISQILLTPCFCDLDFNRDIFEQEKKIFEDNVLAEKNNTRSYSIKRCAELLGEGISLAPSLAELPDLIKNTSFDEIREYYMNIISRSPLEVFYVGSDKPDSIKEKIDRCFAQHNASILHPKMSLVPYSRKTLSSVTEEMDVSQGKLALGFTTGVVLSKDDDRYYTALMLNEIFGGSASSKLFLNVREKMSLCYFCSSSYSIYTGALMVSCGIEPDKCDLAREAILDQLDKIRNGDISDFEMAAAKKSISNSYLQLYDSPFDIQSFYSGRRFFDVHDGIEDCCNKLMRVTAAQISELAKDISLESEFFVNGTRADDNSEEEFDND